MSLTPAPKLISWIESAGMACPEVLSIAQLLRIIGLLALLALALALFSLLS